MFSGGGASGLVHWELRDIGVCHLPCGGQILTMVAGGHTSCPLRRDFSMLRIFQITRNANPSRFLNYVCCLRGQCWQVGDRLPLNLSHGWEQLLRRKATKDCPRKFILMTHTY